MALHLLLFVWSPQPGKAAQQAESKPEPVQILVKGAPAAEESTTVTAPPAAAERKAAPPRLAETVSARARDIAQAMGDLLVSEREPQDGLPPLKIDISHKEELMTAARYFGLKFAVLSNSAQILAEIRPEAAGAVVPFEEDPARFSNRLRHLPSDYFGEQIARYLRDRQARMYLLVPEKVDKYFAQVQKEGIAATGHAVDRVAATRAVFETGQGEPRLKITGITFK